MDKAAKQTRNKKKNSQEKQQKLQNNQFLHAGLLLKAKIIPIGKLLK